MKQVDLHYWVGIGEKVPIIQDQSPKLEVHSKTVKHGLVNDEIHTEEFERKSNSNTPEQLNNKESGSYWLNIDRLTQKSKLHIEGCICVSIAQERGKWKGFGFLTEWRGWLKFSSEQEAIEYYNQKLKPRQYTLSMGCNCLKNTRGDNYK